LRQHLGQFGVGIDINKHRRSRRAFGYLNLFRMRDIALGDACGLFEPLSGYRNWRDFLTSKFWWVLHLRAQTYVVDLLGTGRYSVSEH